jgi:hypothetical protein
MDPAAVQHGQTRLRKAEKAIEALKSATDFESAEEGWSDFLQAPPGIYSKLAQGANVKGSSFGWYGRKKKERKDDPLLRYLHFARNADEHGIERVVSRVHNGPFFGHKPKLVSEYQ